MRDKPIEIRSEMVDLAQLLGVGAACLDFDYEAYNRLYAEYTKDLSDEAVEQAIATLTEWNGYRE